MTHRYPFEKDSNPTLWDKIKGWLDWFVIWKIKGGGDK